MQSSSNDILQNIAHQLNVTDDVVALLNSAFVAELELASSALDSVAIPGFGTFEGEKIPDHVAVNAADGVRTLMPPRLEMNFKSSVVLRKKLNG